MGQTNSTRQGSADTRSEQRPDSASAELQLLQDIEPWKVSRDKVKILKEISVGGWGFVSEGTLRVAVKQLHPQILSKTNMDRLQREMQILAQLRHPNLVQFIGVVLDKVALKPQGSPMIITELLDTNLRKAYEEKLDFNKLSIFQDVAQGLNYLHECHDPIIHRDVSAPNVLLEALPNGTWRGKVSDLGSANLAKLAHSVAPGAIIYAAPETLLQFAHNPSSSPPRQTTKIDVYSYGILLYEVVTGQLPDPDQYHDMLGQVQHQWPFMYRLIISCTHYNPDERPTMAEVLAKLSQPSQSQSVEAYQQEQLHTTHYPTQQPESNHQQLPQQAVQHHPQPQQPPEVHQNLHIGSTVQLTVVSSANQDSPPPPQYGVIRWIGKLPDMQGPMAGIELEDHMEGCTDGTFRMTGQRFFNCQDGRGLYFPLTWLRPDERVTDTGRVPGAAAVHIPNPLDYVAHEEVSDQLIDSQQIEKYLGDQQGIQGHQNSGYLDATVFGLFALSDVFDIVLLKNPTNPTEQDVSNILWKCIVNPLRKNGVVRYESVMMLRNKLEELGKMKGVTQDEKDPEEFLSMLFKHTLHVEPFFSIRRPFGTEQEYFVQLFLEYDESMKLPTVEDLLTKMFEEQSISFTEPPARLLVQMPRFGHHFKMYQKIVPNLSLDVMDLVDSPYSCMICTNKHAWQKCIKCALEWNKKDTHLCLGCTELLHRHPQRADHKAHVEIPEDVNPNLELLSVICIETSHYVCFTRSEDQWILFDSMANRVHDMYYIPRVVDCTRDLKEWVYSGDHQRLLNTPPRELPEYVRRFTQDVYMCVYIQLDAGMYG